MRLYCLGKVVELNGVSYNWIQIRNNRVKPSERVSMICHAEMYVWAIKIHNRDSSTSYLWESVKVHLLCLVGDMLASGWKCVKAK